MTVAVMESSQYVVEEKILMMDPIVVAMANEIRGDVSLEEMESWDFIGAASAEYRSRGGTRARSIGGVARAIRSLLS